MEMFYQKYERCDMHEETWANGKAELDSDRKLLLCVTIYKSDSLN